MNIYIYIYISPLDMVNLRWRGGELKLGCYLSQRVDCDLTYVKERHSFAP